MDLLLLLLFAAPALLQCAVASVHANAPTLVSGGSYRGRPALGPSPSRAVGFSLALRSLPVERDNKYQIVRSHPPTQSNSAAVDQDDGDFTYFISFKFGASETEYHMLLDSGSTQTWVMGSDCSQQACQRHNTFGPDDSQTLTQTDLSFSIRYGTGDVSCTVVHDNVRFSSFHVPFYFGLANNVSDDFVAYPFDGILGLGRVDVEHAPETGYTIMDVLYKQGLIPQKLFGIHLPRASDGLQDGEINFGAPNPERYDGDLDYTSTKQNQRGFWEVPVDGARVDGQAVNLPSNRTVLLDTGTSFILMPPADAKALHALIPGSSSQMLYDQVYSIPCDSTATVAFVFNGISYNISALDYVGDKLDDGSCASNIISEQYADDNQWLVGAVFLKNVYAVFDSDNDRVGFGVKRTPGVFASGASGSSESASGPTAMTSTSSTVGVSSALTTPQAVSTSTAVPTPASGANAGGRSALMRWGVALLCLCLALVPNGT